jgi:hypothetical protein
VLFRGGRRDADVLLAEFDAVGDGVEDILIAASSCFVSDMLSFDVVDMILTPNGPLCSSKIPGIVYRCATKCLLC